MSVLQQTGSFLRRLLSSTPLWGLFFFLWLIGLSGVLSPWMGTPGALQNQNLDVLLQQRKKELAQARQESERLKELIEELEKNPSRQERTIRNRLGYVGENDLVFDFSKTNVH
jgi:cell division protein FtsB